MLVKTIFAGFGGQGVLMMGFCLATAAMEEGLHVTYMPSYGAEVRGGTANCTISISDDEIASPIASSPDILVAMNEPSLMRFQNAIKKDGICVSNQTLISIDLPRKDVTEYSVPAGSIAESVGSIRSANMVILGALVAATDVVPLDRMIETVTNITMKKRKELVDLNVKAIRAGYDYVAKQKGTAGAGKKKKTSKKAAGKTAKKKTSNKKTAKKKATAKKANKKTAAKKKAKK